MLKQINQSLLRNESLQLGFGTLWNLFFNKTKNIVGYVYNQGSDPLYLL